MSNTNAVDKEANEVPKGIRRVTSALSTDLAYAIVIHLTKVEGSTIGEIADDLDTNTMILQDTLSKLQDAGIVVREVCQFMDKTTRIEYRITEFGKEVLDGLFDIETRTRQND